MHHGLIFAGNGSKHGRGDKEKENPAPSGLPQGDIGAARPGCLRLTTKPWSFMLRIRFWPITARPIRAMSALWRGRGERVRVSAHRQHPHPDPASAQPGSLCTHSPLTTPSAPQGPPGPSRPPQDPPGPRCPPPALTRPWRRRQRSGLGARLPPPAPLSQRHRGGGARAERAHWVPPPGPAPLPMG